MSHKPGCPRFSGVGMCDCFEEAVSEVCKHCQKPITRMDYNGEEGWSHDELPLTAHIPELERGNSPQEFGDPWGGPNSKGLEPTVENKQNIASSSEVSGLAAEPLSGEIYLARMGFADSRNYSASELGPLLEAYAADFRQQLQTAERERDEWYELYKVTGLGKKATPEEVADFIADLTNVCSSINSTIQRAEAAESQLRQMREALQQIARECAGSRIGAIASEALLAAQKEEGDVKR